MKITVRVYVEVPGAQGHYPRALSWAHAEDAGDNPAYYGHDVQRALEAAFQSALKGAQPYVVYRPDGWPERPDSATHATGQSDHG